MQTIAHRNESRYVSEDFARSIDVHEEGGTIQGVLWALAIMAPFYVVVYWILML